MKKVFSLKKFQEWYKTSELRKIMFNVNCELWANECDGLTEEEMNKLGYETSDNWMIEVEEKQ